MINEILSKNKELFLKTLSSLYLAVSKKDFKNLSIDSGSEMIDDCRIIFSFYNDFYILDKDAGKIFKTDYPISEGYLKSVSENNKNNQDCLKKIYPLDIEAQNILDNYSSALALSYLSIADGTPTTKQKQPILLLALSY